MLHYIHRLDFVNRGDIYCGYYKYFKYLYNYDIHIHDIENPNIELIKENDIVIIGGGGLINAWNKWNNFINIISSKSKNVILWSVGYNNIYDIEDITVDIDFNKIKMISIRDYNHPSNFRYVPCATCMLPYLNIKSSIKRDIGIISHNYYKFDYNNYDIIYNSDNIYNIMQFIASSNIIISNSYHAIYWATLMRKKVILMYETSTRFHHFKYPPIKYSGDIFNDINLAKIYYNALDESISLTKEYFNDIKLIINETEKKYYYIDKSVLETEKINNDFLFNEIFQSNSKILNLENCIYNQNIEISNLKANLENKNNIINNIINTISWWIPIRKWRDSFRNKMLNKDQTRPDQTRPDQTRPNIYIAIIYIFIIIQNIKKYNLCCNVKLQHRFFIA